MSKRSQRIQIGDLRPGMYVVKLDRPWVSTPFDPQGFPISSVAQVRLLAKYCKAVHVDGERAVKRTRAVGGVRKTLVAARAKPAVRKAGTARARRKAASRAR